MTKKLYYEDSYCREFQATVTGCVVSKHGYEITLDQTAFYPEGGGQPADNGVLLGSRQAVEVFDVHEKEGEVYHYTKEPLEEGTILTGRIDWDRRFDLMQNHSGEHIVSGLVHGKYGYQNVGFHMGSDVLTIDFDGELTPKDLREVEALANQIVWSNQETQIRTYSEEDVKNLEYRSKKELHGEVRIVTFPGADVCACCGTHVKSAGEIGLIKLLSVVKFRSGVRVEMLCGRRALAYLNGIFDQNHRISIALSAKPLETADAVDRLKEAAAAAGYRAVFLENEIFAGKAKALTGQGNLLLFEKDLSPDSLRKLAVEVMEHCGGICAAFSGNEEDGYKYAIGQTGGDLRTMVKELNAALGGRGGGKPFFVQGSVQANKEDIVRWFEERGIRLFC